MSTSSSESPPSEISCSRDYDIVSHKDSAEEQEEEEGWELLDPLSPQVPSAELVSTDVQAPAAEVSLASVEAFSDDELIGGETWELIEEGSEGDGAPPNPVMLAYKLMAITTQVYRTLLGYISRNTRPSTSASTTGTKPLASWVRGSIGSLATALGFSLAMGLLLPENFIWISTLPCVLSLAVIAAAVESSSN